MVLKIVDKRIVGYGSYKHKDTFKFFGCLWDKETKSWYVPDTADYEKLDKVIDAINDSDSQIFLDKWKEACVQCNVTYTKKGTQEYEQVRQWLKTNKSI